MINPRPKAAPISLMGWGDVCHIGCGRGDGGAGDTGDNPAHKQIPDDRCDRHHGIVKGQAEQGCQEDRAASEAIRQIAQDWRKDELHEGIGEDEIAADDRGIGDAAAGQFFQ